MKLAHDVYAETNPALGTFALTEFVKAYVSINAAGPEIPAVYLSLPIALSGDLAAAFGGTNKNTGLLEWLERSPHVSVGLADRVNASMSIVTDAVRFACFTKSLAVTHDARLQLGSTKIKKSAVSVLDESTSGSIKRSERLGYWFATAGSTRNVFNVLGLTV